MANRVVSGAYEGCGIRVGLLDGPKIIKSLSSEIHLNKQTIKEYQVVSASEKRSGSLMRAAVGAAIVGPVGLLAGVTGGKHAIYQIAVTFKNGAKSLLEVDDDVYRCIVKEMF